MSLGEDDRRTASYVLDSSDGTPDLQQNRIQKDRAHSPVPSCVSMKTDMSIGPPLNFKENTPSGSQIQLERPDSPETTIQFSYLEDPEVNIHDKTLNLSCFSPDDVPCDFCTERKQRAVKACLTCCASFCETHIRRHYTVPTLEKHILVEPSGGLEDRDYQQKVEGWITEVLPTPGEIQFSEVRPDSVSLSWGVPVELTGKTPTFKVTWFDGKEWHIHKAEDVNKIQIYDLLPGKEYVFKVSTLGDNGSQSECVSATVCTDIPAPSGLTVDNVERTRFTVSWHKPELLDQTPHRYQISSNCPGTVLRSTTSLQQTFKYLEPGTQYTVEVATVLESGEKSKPVKKNIWTRRKAKKRPWTYDSDEPSDEEDDIDEYEDDYEDDYNEDEDDDYEEYE